MALLIDTHAHLYHKGFAQDSVAMLARAAEVCELILLPGIDSESIGPLKELWQQHPSLLRPMAGLHPCSVKDNYLHELALAEAELASGYYIAVGEAGIDLYWDKSTLALQQAALRVQLGWANALRLPIVLHSRNAFQETIALVEEAQDGNLTGVFHCFTDTLADAERVLAAGFYIGIGGVLTYKNNGGLDATLAQLDRSRVVLETDAPYLAPAPHRGKRNESSYITHVAQRLALAWGCTYDEVARVTSENAKRLFQLD